MKAIFIGAGALLGLIGLGMTRHAAPPVPVVVELFTSEGCSSCPAADAVLRELASTQPVPGVEVVALGEHVDYWNRLGWQDQFSAPAYTRRQREYVSHLGGDAYTPQAVVQGREELIGSRRSALLAAIGRAARAPHAAVALSGGAAGQPVRVRVGQLPAGTGPARVLLFITESDLATQVGAGENAGAHLRHAPLVRRVVPLGTLGQSSFDTTLTLPTAPGWNPAHLRAVAVVQAVHTGQVVGVQQLALAAAH